MTARKCVLTLIMLAMLPGVMFAQNASRFEIEKPDGRENFVTDKLEMISNEDKAAINAMCKALLRDQAVPVIVVVIDSMESSGPSGMSIEEYTRALFDEWGIGHPNTVINGQKISWNHGMLLMVSILDRKARIELGADWANKRNTECQRVMDEMIIPYFKNDRYSTGIREGVNGLDKIGRGLILPNSAYGRTGNIENVKQQLIFFVVVSILAFGGVGYHCASMIYGWPIIFRGFDGRHRGGGSGGGGFSGGSFGGGFGGGGGASGSW